MKNANIAPDAKLLQRGYYVDFYELPDGGLRMVRNGKDTFKEIYDVSKAKGIDWAFVEMIEDFTSNGWKIFTSEELGALTDAIMFGQDYEYDDDSDELKNVGRVYFNNHYATRNEIEELFLKGYYDFSYVD